MRSLGCDATTRGREHQPCCARKPRPRHGDPAISATGITYVVAAGNGNVNSADLSPARIGEAVTVGATASRDQRASFPEFWNRRQPVAPGKSIVSAAMANNTAIGTMSGTSMASAHAAGVAALRLGDQPDASPANVHSSLIAAATTGALTGVGARSPNRFLYSRSD